MKLQKDLREFIELLNSMDVKYVMVGGHAVAYHGFPRFTADIDFFIDCGRTNTRKLAELVTQFGFRSLADDLSSAQPGMVFQLGRPPHRIDLLTSIDGVTFEEAWQSRIFAAVDGLQVPMLSKELLLRNKRSSGRSKDLEDVDQLEGE